MATNTKLRGFGSMDRSLQRTIASKGGRAAHDRGTAHEWTTNEARDAGRKGGLVTAEKRRQARAAAANVANTGNAGNEAGL